MWPTSQCAPNAAAVFRTGRSGCSDVEWQARVADAMPRSRPVTYVNVGANKGYRIPEFLGLWSQRPVPGHSQAWGTELRRYAQEHKMRFLQAYACGNCNDCKAAAPAPHNRSGARMHLLELAPPNRALLGHMLDTHKLHRRVHLHHYAASNVSQTLVIPKTVFAGDERVAANTAKASRLARAGADESVQAVALDDFFATQRLKRLYHVAIDTEGWDALVVRRGPETIPHTVPTQPPTLRPLPSAHGVQCLVG